MLPTVYHRTWRPRPQAGPPPAKGLHRGTPPPSPQQLPATGSRAGLPVSVVLQLILVTAKAERRRRLWRAPRAREGRARAGPARRVKAGRGPAHLIDPLLLLRVRLRLRSRLRLRFRTALPGVGLGLGPGPPLGRRGHAAAARRRSAAGRPGRRERRRAGAVPARGRPGCRPCAQASAGAQRGPAASRGAGILGRGPGEGRGPGRAVGSTASGCVVTAARQRFPGGSRGMSCLPAVKPGERLC